MIVRMQASGGSFLGAGKYYLHDKLDADRAALAAGGERVAMRDQTDDRVWFTDTRNCLNNDPERAFEEMWRTADDQAWLKMQAGVKRGGRVCEDAVKTLSLSWHKDDRPTPEHMIESADAFLKHMGWDNHQAVYVGHNDTEHRHIHIVLNRIDPENGRTLDDFRERKRAQAWALGYEKEHENLRCEQRAAKREHRAPELDRDRMSQHEQHQAPAQSLPQPANDHLPHNVIMLSREHERAFQASEQARETSDRDLRAELKAEQRAERETFFKDGAKQFKALRHAVYDEVRKDYAPEWKKHYADAKAAENSAEAWSKSAVTRALYFAKQGQWHRAEAAFADRDSVRDAVEAHISERKHDLKARQTDDLRERQREACDALRQQREVQYQDLLLRQRYERGVLGAAATLEALGQSSPEAQPAANQNEDAAPPAAASLAKAPEQQGSVDNTPSPIELGQAALARDLIAVIDEAFAAENGSVLHPPMVPTASAPAVTHQLTDLAAGAVGSVASYVADQLGELFAPTPPEVREAHAKEAAKREADKPTLSENAGPYAKIIDAALRDIEAERAAGKDDAYWKERDRGKDWERDQ